MDSHRFCWQIGIVAAGLLSNVTTAEKPTLPLPPLVAHREASLDSLRHGFAQPPQAAGPWVYWFWWDNAVTRDEIVRELKELADAGFAGAEIRCVDAAWLRDRFKTELPLTGHKPLEYLSPEFLECLEHACATARRLGLRLGLNLGMGWPPGGTWVTEPHRSKVLLSESAVFQGGGAVEIAVPERVPRAEWVLAWRLEDANSKRVDPKSFTDLTSSLSGADRKLRWDFPSGTWLVGFFSVGLGGALDKATGYPADPGSAEAMRFHLNYLFSRLDPVLSPYYGNTLTDIASDSWEYDGRSAWSPGLCGEFELVTGGKLLPRMHVTLGYGPEVERVRTDLERTENSLVQRNYFELITAFVNQRGLRHRSQPRGRGLYRDLFDSYAHCDIPEVEQEINPAEATWVAHCSGKPIIGIEAYTFLSHYNSELGEFGKSFGPWQANPDLLRRHANLHFARGINRLQMHSFSYSPPALELPGWRMYAEIHLNRNVVWWPYMGLLNTWLARNQYILQAGAPVADAVVYPVRTNPPEFGIGEQRENQPVAALNSVDAVNRSLFRQLNKGGINGPYDFNHLVLIADLQSREEVEHLVALMSAGVRVICCKSMPETWATLKKPAAKDASWAGETLGQIRAAEKAGTLLDSRNVFWKQALTQLRSIKWSPAESELSFQHRRVRGGEIYFVVNHGPAFAGEVAFPHPGLTPELWDADTGRTAVAEVYRKDADRSYVTLSLEPYNSALVVFSDRLGAVRTSDAVNRKSGTALPAAVPVSGRWKLHADKARCHGIAASVSLTLDRLVSWRDLPQLKTCAGIVTYTAQIELPPGSVRDDCGWLLDLGQVYELAQVTLNQRPVGTSWTAPYRIDVTAFLRDGRNEMELNIPNLLEDRLNEAEHTRPSGLLGPVLLRSYGKTPVKPSPLKSERID